MLRIAIALLLTPFVAGAQQYIVSTFAGGAAPPLSALATATYIGLPAGIATDPAGNIYFTSLNCVFRLDSKGTLARIAGTGAGGYAGDGLAATSAQLFQPGGIAVDRSGNIYVADSSNARIRRITPAGIIATVAGNGTFGFSGDGGPAVSSQLMPSGVAVDAAGNLIVYDSGNLRIRRITPDGIIRTIAGNGVRGFAGDGGPALSASLTAGSGMAADSDGNVYFADESNGRIRKIDTAGNITTVAGGGTGGDGAPATQASLGFVSGVALDSTGRLFISTASSIRVVATSGIISTLSPPASTADPIFGINALAVDASGSVLIADVTGRIRAISPNLGLTTLAGPGSPSFGQNQNPLSVRLEAPSSIAADASGNILIADYNNDWLYRVSPAGILTVIGHPREPAAVAVDSLGNYYVVDNGTIVKANFTGSVPPAPVIVAGGGTGSAEGVPATSALFVAPNAIAVDGSGNLFIADSQSKRVHKVSPSGIINTFAGGGPAGQLGEGGPATAAGMCPVALATDAVGNLYISDFCSRRIRKVTPAGIISTAAGGGVSVNGADSGDGGPALDAAVSPGAIALDGAGNLFVLGGDGVRKVSGGLINTIARMNQIGYSGDGGPASQAAYNAPSGIAVDSAGRVYMPELNNAVVRVLTPAPNPVLASAVLDAASESAAAITPGKIVVVYGSGLGPASVAVNTPSQTSFGVSVAGTRILFNGVPAPMIYASANQAAAIAPYEIAGSASVSVVVQSGAGVSDSFTVPVAPASPSMFTANLTGAGHIAAVNHDGTINTAANPANRGDFISFYATGEGQTVPPGTDGALANGALPRPVLPVQVTIGGIDAPPVYAGAAPTEVSGLMQIVVYIPAQVQPGGYVPVELKIGSASTASGAAWIAVSDK